MSGDYQRFVSFVGAMVQLASSVLLVMLFLLLRPYARRRRYFVTWSIGWVVLLVALAATALRYTLDPASVRGGSPATSATILLWVYQFAKLTFILLMVAGANQFARPTSLGRTLIYGIPLALLYSTVSISLTRDVFGTLLWQAPVAVFGFGWCAVRIGGVTASRHGIGTHLAGSVFAVLSLLWVVYFFLFGHDPAAIASGESLLGHLLRYNSFIDGLLYVLLGFGMVLLMMEQAKREVDDANAELAVAHSAMRRAALYDSLTGCLNRRAFSEGVGLENARGSFGAVMMFDLDDLKDVNDRYGHSAGDALLRHLTDSLRAELRPSDKLYRWGGDEFMLLLPGADEGRARGRLRAVLNEAAVLHLGALSEEVRLNVSMGSASWANADQILDSIDFADAMMYREKARKKLARA